MGQGRYMALVFGLEGLAAEALMDKAMPLDGHGFRDDWATPEIKALAEKARAPIRRRYESATEWVGAVVAINDEVLSPRWGGALLRKGAWALDKMAADFPEDIERARLRWEAFTAEVEKATGYKAPEGRLLLVFDFH